MPNAGRRGSVDAGFPHFCLVHDETHATRLGAFYLQSGCQGNGHLWIQVLPAVAHFFPFFRVVIVYESCPDFVRFELNRIFKAGLSIDRISRLVPRFGGLFLQRGWVSVGCFKADRVFFTLFVIDFGQRVYRVNLVQIESYSSQDLPVSQPNRMFVHFTASYGLLAGVVVYLWDPPVFFVRHTKSPL